METKRIIDLSKDYDSIFNDILRETENALQTAIQPFSNYYALETEDFISFLKYDYDTLLAITLYNLLNIIGIKLSKYFTEIDIYPNMYSYGLASASDMDINRKRLRRIKEQFMNRNEKNLEYFNSQKDYIPETLLSDVKWYDLISDYPILKRFLFKDDYVVKKTFFDDLNDVYNEINQNEGYDRFNLLYKLEVNSKIELFYNVLAKIKKEKRRLKLPDSKVQDIIEQMAFLHTVPITIYEFKDIIKYSSEISVFNEIMNLSPQERTLNGIVFNINEIADYFVKEPKITIDFIKTLNFISNAVVFHLFIRISGEINQYKVIDNLMHCNSATDFFDNYLNSHNIYKNDKNCSKDITFTHFKKIYNMKK